MEFQLWSSARVRFPAPVTRAVAGQDDRRAVFQDDRTSPEDADIVEAAAADLFEALEVHEAISVSSMEPSSTSPTMVPRFQIVCEFAIWMAIGPPDETTPPTSLLSERLKVASRAGPTRGW